MGRLRRKKFRFPVFAVIILVFSIYWFLDEVEIIHTKLPWIPVVLMIIAVGMIFNRVFE